jgi:5-methylcytosine-specific restriction endonuclease McrA
VIDVGVTVTRCTAPGASWCCGSASGPRASGIGIASGPAHEDSRSETTALVAGTKCTSHRPARRAARCGGRWKGGDSRWDNSARPSDEWNDATAHVARSVGAEGYLTVDHVVPRDCGGMSDDSNLQLLCYPCNQWKSNRPMSREDFHRARANRELQREGYFKHRARMIRFAKEMLRAAGEG